MATTTVMSSKRVLGDATNVHRNVQDSSPNLAKKRKLDVVSSPASRFRAPQAGHNGKLGSSQPKSQFEEEVLEKLSQGINELKQKNSERDQQWTRPSLEDFHEKRDSLCFQQIEAEGGNFYGKATVKLFGVTEVRLVNSLWMPSRLNPFSTYRRDTLCCCM